MWLFKLKQTPLFCQTWNKPEKSSILKVKIFPWPLKKGWSFCLETKAVEKNRLALSARTKLKGLNRSHHAWCMTWPVGHLDMTLVAALWYKMVEIRSFVFPSSDKHFARIRKSNFALSRCSKDLELSLSLCLYLNLIPLDWNQQNLILSAPPSPPTMPDSLAVLCASRRRPDIICTEEGSEVRIVTVGNPNVWAPQTPLLNKYISHKFVGVMPK